jgi:hypothetical protein
MFRFLYLWVFPCVLKLIVLPDALLNSPIGKGEGALSVPFFIPVFTDIFAPIGSGVGALSVEVAIPEFTDIFVPTGKGEGAKTISPRVLVITAGALRQTPRLSGTEQQHSKTEAQKHSELSHAGKSN